MLHQTVQVDRFQNSISVAIVIARRRTMSAQIEFCLEEISNFIDGIQFDGWWNCIGCLRCLLVLGFAVIEIATTGAIEQFDRGRSLQNVGGHDIRTATANVVFTYAVRNWLVNTHLHKQHRNGGNQPDMLRLQEVRRCGWSSVFPLQRN